MSVTSYNELSGKRRSSIDENGHRQHTIVYQAITNDKTEDTYSVLVSVMLSLSLDLYVSHPVDSAAVLTNPSCNNQGNYEYELTFNYKTLTQEEQEELGEDPRDKAVVIGYDTEAIEYPLDFDATNQPVVNSAKMPYDPTITENAYAQIFTYQKNMNAANFSSIAALQNKVNDATWEGKATGMALCRKVSGRTENKIVDDVNINYVNANVTVAVSPWSHGWKKQILDAGLYEFDGTNHTPILIKGSPPTGAVALDGSGHVLPSGNTPVINSHVTKVDADFAVLSTVLGL